MRGSIKDGKSDTVYSIYKRKKKKKKAIILKGGMFYVPVDKGQRVGHQGGHPGGGLL